MTLTQKGVKVVAGRMPKMITPRAHAALDYAIAGSFFLMGALFWKRNRRAGMGSLLCGGATAAVSVLTDYPGGVKKVIPYPLREQIDTGLIAMAAAMPRLMDVEDKRDAKFFSRQATRAAMKGTGVWSLTRTLLHPNFGVAIAFC